ncbi:MAG TPA: hypothetical protein PLE19_04130 [Planctomycetota bacterium]|nr:hypothetical protein [Planctomycetota bacterium]HRR80461.1 hypothetical protein [Planctomycetota bacterium]HRT97075.1 hypothetical protein [Planctomycetota bacterium]
MREGMSRREFVRSTVAASAGSALAFGAGAARAGEAPAGPAKPLLPTGKIGKLAITRLILGGNLLGRYNHARDLRYVLRLVKEYNTDEKILQTLALAEASGINTVSVHVSNDTRRLLKEHREKRGGKLQWILYPTSNIEDWAGYSRDVQQIADDGAEACYVWGVHTDGLVAKGKLDVVAKAVELIKANGMPAGVCAHDLRVIQECEKAKVPVDFYIKTFHHLKYPSAKMDYDSIWCRNPEETAAFMASVEKPWIAFKVMAAGAIPPKDAFRFAFEGGADFIFAGMFDFDIAEDVQITRDILAGEPKRSRPWRA